VPTKFASGKHSISECDRCGFRYKRKELKLLTIKTKNTNILVCPTCWEKDHPQLQLGMYPVNDPQAIRDPRPDNSYLQSGLTGLQIFVVDPPDPEAEDAFGTPAGGSRQVQWGWGPVGLNDPLGLSGLANALVGQGAVGTVTVGT
jgi:hypothetical protein